MMLTKKCAKCKTDQPVNLFGNLSSSSDGLKYRCKSCTKVDKDEFRKRHPEKVKQYISKWKNNNSDKASAGNNRRFKVWYDKNKKIHRTRVLNWEFNNPGMKSLYSSIRRFRQANQTILLSDVQKREIADIYARAKFITEKTGVKHHVDHIFPLAGKRGCGLHVPWNLQIISATENCSKGIRMNEF